MKRQRPRKQTARDPSPARVLGKLLRAVVGPYRDERLQPVGIRSSHLEELLVLADGLEEHNFGSLADKLRKKAEAIRTLAPGWARGTPLLLRRVERAIRIIRAAERGRPRGRGIGQAPGPRRPNARLEEAYRFFRAQGMNADEAMRHARAEAYAIAHGYAIYLDAEHERYEDVYGETPPPDVDFLYVALQNRRGETIDNIGFVPRIGPHFVRRMRAELTLNLMRRRRRR